MNRTLVWLAAFVAQSALIPAQGLQRDQSPTLAGTAAGDYTIAADPIETPKATDLPANISPPSSSLWRGRRS